MTGRARLYALERQGAEGRSQIGFAIKWQVSRERSYTQLLHQFQHGPVDGFIEELSPGRIDSFAPATHIRTKLLFQNEVPSMVPLRTGDLEPMVQVG